MSLKEYILRRISTGANVEMGKRVHVGLGSQLWAPERLVIGNDVYIGRFVTIEVDGSIGDGCLIANNVGVIGRRDHDVAQIGVVARDAPWVGDFPTRLSSPTFVEEDVWIGFGAIILSGVRIGKSAVVAAGSVVVEDVSAGLIVGGVPARRLGSRFNSQSELEDHWQRCGFVQ